MFEQFQISYKYQIEYSIEPEQAARRVYHLEDGFVPIVTNHGSALEANPEPRGVILNLAPQGKFFHLGSVIPFLVAENAPARNKAESK